MHAGQACWSMPASTTAARDANFVGPGAATLAAVVGALNDACRVAHTVELTDTAFASNYRYARGAMP